MSEQVESKSISVYIDGDKSCFVSKIAVDKFKHTIRSCGTENPIDLDVLSSKYIKPEFKLELVNKNYNEYKFKIIKKEIPEKISEKTSSRELLRAKLNLMSKTRTNSNYHKAKSSDLVNDEILSEYNKLLKVSKMPIPEPSEILSKPDEYKPIISMVLQNQMIKQLGSTHPYVKYFKLLAKELGISNPTNNNFIEEQELPKIMDSSKLFNIVGNSMSSQNDDTDDEN